MSPHLCPDPPQSELEVLPLPDPELFQTLLLTRKSLKMNLCFGGTCPERLAFLAEEITSSKWVVQALSSKARGCPSPAGPPLSGALRRWRPWNVCFLGRVLSQPPQTPAPQQYAKGHCELEGTACKPLLLALPHPVGLEDLTDRVFTIQRHLL